MMDSAGHVGKVRMRVVEAMPVMEISQKVDALALATTAKKFIVTWFMSSSSWSSLALPHQILTCNLPSTVD